MHNSAKDIPFSFTTFSDFCIASSHQRELSFQTILKEYFAAHPAHGADFYEHFQQHPELYAQLNYRMHAARATILNDPSASTISWKDRMHRDDDTRGSERF